MNAVLRRLWPFMPRLDRTYRVIGITADRRNQGQRSSYSAIEQERADIELEREWRRRVRQNEIRRMEQKLLARTEAELLDPDPQFDDWRDAAADDAGVPRFGEI